MLAMDICANPTDGTQSWQPAGLTPGANSTRLSIMIQEWSKRSARSLGFMPFEERIRRGAASMDERLGIRQRSHFRSSMLSTTC